MPIRARYARVVCNLTIPRRLLRLDHHTQHSHELARKHAMYNFECINYHSGLEIWLSTSA